jgi:FMN-dependent NADH-azoreductase
MSKLLFVKSSLFGRDGKSTQIASEFVDALRRVRPGITVVERNLDADSIPHLSGATMAALMTPSEKRTKDQDQAVAFADSLIEEVESADTLVLAVPMYNFSVPSTFKAWIDHITRAGRTFRYGAAGPEGLLKGKKVFLIVSRGGVYTGDSPAKPLDFQEPYLRSMLGFLGLDDLTFIHVEGLQVSPESAAAGLDRARKAISVVLPRAA